MNINGKAFRTIWFDNNIVKIIDQTKLPHQFIIKELKTVKDTPAIKNMEVRGAPLIEQQQHMNGFITLKKMISLFKKSSEDLIKTRPTAINLKWAVDRMMKKLSGVNSEEILNIAIEEAKNICEEDVGFCKNIGVNGLKIIEEISKKERYNKYLNSL